MNIAMIGTGYVGLVTGTLFADKGNQVVCVDKNPAIVDRLENGESPIYEPGLEELIQKNHGDTLHFTQDIGDIRDSEIVFLGVGTPSREDGEFNLKYLTAAAQDVATTMADKKNIVLVTKSTVPQGTWKVLGEIIDQHMNDWHYVSNPETLAEGTAVRDFSKPDRVIVGTDSDFAFSKMHELYAPFVHNENPILRMSPASAELAKLGANTFLAMRVAANNELAQICDVTQGADYLDVMRGMTTDPRIGTKFRYAGPGYGGSCFPKDVQGLVHQAKMLGVIPDLLDTIHTSNEDHKRYCGEQILKNIGIQSPHVALWGLTFKPNTDDMRDSPSIPISQLLIEQGASVTAYDPIDTKAKAILPAAVRFNDDQYEAVNNADALVLLTEWNQFDAPDFDKLARRMRGRKLIDLRNRWDPKTVNSHGFDYVGMGRAYTPAHK